VRRCRALCDPIPFRGFMMTLAAADPVDRHRLLVRNLLRAQAFPHPVAALECIETHISSVVLAGEFAYKLKKPLDLGFLDFSTLARRRAACDEELRLNRRTAPELYLEVVAIGGSPESPRIGVAGDQAIDYAVRMRRFAQSALLGAVLQRGEPEAGLFERLARQVADFHAAAAVAGGDSGFGRAAAVHAPVRENFVQLRALLDDVALRAQLDALEAWSEARFARLAPVFEQRRSAGRVRECHGDLHLGNLVLLDGEPRLFDAIEFNPALRWIDVVADIAFLVMDLQVKGRDDLASRFLNAWLECSGDYAGLALLPYYIAYRALVRAKVEAIRLVGLDEAARAAGQAVIARHLALAAAQAARPAPFLLLSSGLSGSGKTSQSQALIERRGIVRVRADVERKRLFGLAPEARSGSAPGAGLYTALANRRTYARLAGLAAAVIGAGYPVLVDAACLRRAQRQVFRDLAARLRVACVLLVFDAPPALLLARVQARTHDGRDASEAGPAVLQAQFGVREALDAAEGRLALQIDTTTPVDWVALQPQLDALLAGR
jgi:aminoglycoside phosphotransferase family enzyme/predicted kinase